MDLQVLTIQSMTQLVGILPVGYTSGAGIVSVYMSQTMWFCDASRLSVTPSEA